VAAKKRKTKKVPAAAVRKIARLCAAIAKPKKRAKAKKKKSTKRDPGWFGHSKAHSKAAKKGARKAKRRAPKKRAARRDPSWYGHPKAHAKAAKKGHRRAGRKTTRRDPAWFGHSAAHSKAAKKGHRRTTRRRDPVVLGDPAWFGHAKAHKTAAKKGLRKQGLSGKTWHAKMQRAKAAKSRRRRDPAGDPRSFRRSSLGRRQRAASPWYVSHDPGSYHPGKGRGRGR